MPKTSNTLTALRTATKGLLYTSESDAPIKAISWDASEVGEAKTPQEAVAKVASAEPGFIEAQSLDTFFGPLTTPADWWGDEEKAIGQQFTTLQQSLSALSDAGVFRVVSGTKVDIYIVGHDPDNPGSFLGVKTRATET